MYAIRSWPRRHCIITCLKSTSTGCRSSLARLIGTCVRLDSAYRRPQEHSVELPTEVRGWFLIRKLQLEQASEAMLMTHAKGSLKHEDVVRAMQSSTGCCEEWWREDQGDL